MATYVATTTINFACGLSVVAVGDSAKDVEAEAIAALAGDDIYAQTKLANLRVRSLSALKRAPRGAQAWRDYEERVAR